MPQGNLPIKFVEKNDTMNGYKSQKLLILFINCRISKSAF